MAARFPIARDIFERVASTFVVALLGMATADGVGWVDWFGLASWKAWAGAALIAAFTLLKTLVATQIAKRNGQATSASLDPGVRLQPDAGSPQPV